MMIFKIDACACLNFVYLHQIKPIHYISMLSMIWEGEMHANLETWRI